MKLALSKTLKTGFVATRPIYEPAHTILLLIAYAQKPPLNTSAYISGGVRILIFGLSLQLHPYTAVLCMHIARAMESLCICAAFPKPSLFDNVISILKILLFTGFIIWALLRENLSSGFPTKRD